MPPPGAALGTRAEALDAIPPRLDTRFLFPARRGGPFDLANFRRREWAPAVEASGVRKPARIYDLRSTFASNALAAGVSVFELARIMGTSSAMIERHYGTLIEGAGADIARRLDVFEAAEPNVVATKWRPTGTEPCAHSPKLAHLQEEHAMPPAGLEPATRCLEGSRSIQLSYGGLREGYGGAGASPMLGAVPDESPLRRTDEGLVPETGGWFVVNAAEARWWDDGPFGWFTRFSGDERFTRIGINLAVLEPGQPNCLYHREDEQEDFLVLSGECLLLVEEEERTAAGVGLRALPARHGPRVRGRRRRALRAAAHREPDARRRDGLPALGVGPASRRRRGAGDGLARRGVRILSRRPWRCATAKGWLPGT